ncbi:phosphatase PAP2 family protein [Carnobacteriaceae bacterium 52-44]
MNKKLINPLNNFITFSIYCLYPLVLLFLAFTHDGSFCRAFLTPTISFVIVSIFRNFINAPRPYEVSDTVPIIKKETKGKSFPSRHVFSVFVIATTLFYIFKPLGIILMLAGILLAILRVVGGVHFSRDVIAGAIIGIFSGVLGFYL